ncbi:alpha/beta-hydrolase [Aspergillus heterothallicus]
MASSDASTFPFTIKEHTIEAQHIREYPHATKSANDALKLAVKQYTPKSNPIPQPGDVTIIGAHGAAFPKELYEPIWHEIYDGLSQQGIRIRSIWIADTASQSASGELNREMLGNDASWFDHARDLLYMINQFKAEMPQPIVGIGHSLGAGQMTLLSLLHPRLLSSLILMEPVMEKDVRMAKGPIFVKLSLGRKDTWPSREQAATYFRKQYKKWDPRVVDLWLQHGLRDIDDSSSSSSGENSGVTLLTSRSQEVTVYLRPNFTGRKPLSPDSDVEHDATFHPDVIGPENAIAPFYRLEPVLLWKMLKHIRPPVLYLFGERSPVSQPERQEEKIQRTGSGISGSGGYKRGLVRGVSVPGAGHHLPFEEVSRVSQETVSWLKGEMERWKREEERVRKGWQELSQEQRTSVSDEWYSHLKGGEHKKTTSKL